MRWEGLRAMRAAGAKEEERKRERNKRRRACSIHRGGCAAEGVVGMPQG